MKRLMIILSVVFVLGAAPLVAEDMGAKPTSGLEIVGGLSYYQSIYSGYLAPHVEIGARWDLLSLAGGIKYMKGFSFNDDYLFGYGEFAFGWFYIDLGLGIALSPGVGNTDHPTIIQVNVNGNPLFMGEIGLDIPLLDLGSGTLGLNIAYAMQTVAGPAGNVNPFNTGNPLRDIIVTIALLPIYALVAILPTVINWSSLSFGLNYSMTI